MNKIEILAPCGNMESVYYAIRSGADAVYLGLQDFSARANAENFTYEKLKEAVQHCHINRAKVYLTLNTVIFDKEFEKIKEAVIKSAECKIDGVIVQNIGVASVIKKIVPDLPLHASTQMSVHSLGGAKLLYEMGFKRIVLSREMTKEQIKEIADNCPVELEVFVHGALCMSVSGQCYFSAMLGSRSGNRGKCAQPCRLPFSVSKNNSYSLSLKDYSIIKYIKELEEIGVCSAKIEGRMKRPEYVSSAVKACVEMRDFGMITEETQNQLNGVFSRTGFTDGYFTGKMGYEMFGHRQKEDVISATPKLLSEIRGQCNKELQKIKLVGKINCKIDEKPIFTISDGKYQVEITGKTPCEKAINKSIDTEKVVAQLKKTGGTPYVIEKIDVEIQDNLSLPLSEINDLRRKAIESLNLQVINEINYKINDVKLPDIVPYESKNKKKTYIRAVDINLPSAFKQADLVFIPLFSSENEVENLMKKGYKIGVEIPRGLFGREEKIKNHLKKILKIGVKDVLCNNLGAVYIAKESGANIHGGFGLNFVNTFDLLWAEDYGFVDTELSFELKLSQISNLGGNIQRGIITYGYLPLMITRNCPKKSENISCKNCNGQGKMKDRLNKTFIFTCDGNVAEILNPHCLDVLEECRNLRSIDFNIYRFSVENYVEKVENILDFIRFHLKNTSKTQGLYKRGVI